MTKAAPFAAATTIFRSGSTLIIIPVLVAIDIGASTGGFTDVLLARGAARVYAVDVGYGQLAEKLRRDGKYETGNYGVDLSADSVGQAVADLAGAGATAVVLVHAGDELSVRDYLDEAAAIGAAVRRVLGGGVRTGDIAAAGGRAAGTAEITERIVAELQGG